MKKARFEIRLRELMREKGVKRGEVVTQSELARATGLSYPTIQRLHRGDVERLEAETVRRLTNFFECKVSDLIGVE